MKRISVAGLVLVAAFALSVVDSSPASAAKCLEILEPLTETGNFTSQANCSARTFGAGDWVYAALWSPIIPGHDCAKIPTGFTMIVEGWGTNQACQIRTPKRDEGPFIRIKIPVIIPFPVPPRFKVLPTVKTLKGNIGSVVLDAGTESVECAEGTSAGEVTSTDALGKVVLKLTGCTETSGSGTCTVKSPSAGEGELVTHTLKGELGTAKSSEAASDVGLLLEPETTKKVMTLASTKCSPETTVSGSLAGEVLPISVKQSIGWVTFATTSKKQDIKNITVLSGAKTLELEAFGSTATEEAINELEFGGEIEII
jgi:hypothetical protein